MHNVSDPAEAVRGVIRDGFFEGPAQEMTADVINDYVNNYPGRRRHIHNIWRQLTDAMQQVTPQMVRRAQTEHLWHGWRKRHQERLSKFLGGGVRRDITKIFNDSNIVPREGYNTNFVLNYQDVPGRTCAFQFLGEHGNHYLKMFRPTLNHKKEGGLAMLDALSAIEGTVYATNDSTFALHMHSRHFHNWNKPLKLVLFNAMSELAWDSVVADRVIFWSPKPDINVIDKARRVANGWITTRPSIGTRAHEEMYRYFWSKTMPDIISMMDRSAKPWREYIIEVLLSRSTEVSRARELALQLQLDINERREIIELCPRSGKARLAALLEDVRAVRTERINNVNVAEKVDGWYQRKAHVGDELLSDAKISIQRELVEPVSAKAFWEGTIIFQRKEVNFHTDVDIIKKDPEGWITKLLLKAGLGTPTIQPKWRPYLMVTAKVFSSYKKMVASRKIGIHSNGHVVFPTFRIKDGQVERNTAFMDTPDTPARELKQPRRRPMRIHDTPGPATAAYIAIGSAFVANLVAEYTDEPQVPIAVVGDHGSLARDTMKSFAAALGMTTHTLSIGHATLVQNIRNGYGAFGYPTYIDPIRGGMLSSYPVLNTDHVFIGTTPLEASALSVGGRWTFINGAGFDPTGSKIPPADDVLMYLADLQGRGFPLTEGRNLQLSVLQDFLSWYEKYLRKPLGEVRAEAERLLRFPLEPGDDLLRLAIQLYRAGRLNLEHAIFMNLADPLKFDLKVGIVIDDEFGQVFISRSALLAAIRKAKLPLPELRAATENLAARKLLHPRGAGMDGWIVPRPAWEGSVAGCLG